MLVGLNGFFVAAEFALVRVRDSRIQQLEQEGSVRAGVVRNALRDLDAYLSVCQVGITMASLGLGWVGEPAVAHLIEPVLGAIGVTSERAVSIIAFVLGFAIITYAHLVFGEQAPKYFSIQRAERTALWISRPLRVCMVLFRPLVWIVNASTNFILRPWGIRLGEDMEAHSEEELRIMISSSTASGELEPGEREYLNNVFDFGDRVAREIMVPRPDIEALRMDSPLPEMVDAAVFGRYTRYPVYEEDLDHVLGAVHVKDLLRAGRENPDDFDVRSLIRECLVVPENKPIEQILKEFQQRKLQMAIVIDEWGSVEGLITIEDVLEELVGEIQDEYDPAEPEVRALDDGSFLVPGGWRVDECERDTDIELPEGDYDTIGGLIMERLGRVPRVGDVVDAGDARLTVQSMEHMAVESVRLERRGEP